MGDMADDAAWPYGLPDEEPPGYWMQRNGEVIAMRQMTDSHLRATIAMLRRNGGMGEKEDELVAELQRRQVPR